MRFRLPLLEDMPLLWRIALAAMIVALAVILVLLATYVFGVGESSAAAQQEPPPPKLEMYAGMPYDQHLLDLDRKALEQAYSNRLTRLFDVWLTSTSAKDATSFVNGLQIARRGYAVAAAQITRREEELKQKQKQPGTRND